MHVKAMLLSDHDHTILAECERDEEAVIGAYKAALTGDLPRYIREIVEGQLEQIGLAQGQILQLEKTDSA